MRRARDASWFLLVGLAVVPLLAPSAGAADSATPAPACGRVLTGPDFPRPLLSDAEPGFGVRYLDLDGDGAVEPVGFAQLAFRPDGRSFQLYRGTVGPDGRITYAPLLPPVDEARLSSPRELVAGDVDGDGIPDLVVFWWGHNRRDGPKYLDVHRGLGNGAVAPAERTTWDARRVNGPPVLADFDGDGKREIVLQWKRCINIYFCPETQLELWSWDASQGFVGRYGHLGPESAERAPAVLDVDGDGLDDLVTEHRASSFRNDLGVRYGDRGALLRPLQLHRLPYLSSGVYALDLEGSGRERLIVRESPPFFFFYSPTRLHRIESLVPSVVDGWTQTILANLSASAAVAEDLDGDGRTDLRFRQPGGGFFFGGHGGFQILWGNGDRPLTEGPRSRTTPVILAALDVDGDGMRDVVTDASYSLSGNARPTFYPAIAPRQLDEGVFATPLSSGYIDEPYINTSIGDVNGDGLDDVLTLTLYHDAFTLALAKGDGTFEVRDLPRPEENWWDADLHDMDGDGLLDLALVPDYISTEIGVARGRGDGTFEPVQRFDLGGEFRSFWYGDLDGDGRTDILARSYPGWSAQTMVPFLAGEDAFVRGETFDVIARFGIGYVVLTDLDGDGRADVAYRYGPDVDTDPKRIAWRRSLGDGSFGPPSDVLDETFPSRVEEIKATDFDVDGKTDLFVRLVGYFGTPDYVSIRGNGRGGFREVWRGNRIEFRDLDILTDVNGDGRPDLVKRKPDDYNYDSTLTYETSVRLGDGLGGFGDPLPGRWHSFGGYAGTFRSRGGRDLVRVATIDQRFQLEVNPNLGRVLPQDVAPPEVEVGVTPIVTVPDDPGVVDVAWELTMVPIDECDSAPRITRSVVDLVPLGGGTTVSFEPAAAHEVLVFARGEGTHEVLLRGPDEAAARAAFEAARGDGGYPFESFGVLRLAAAGEYGPPGDAYGASGRLTQHLVLDGGVVVEAGVFRPGGDVTFSLTATDRSGRAATTRLSYLEFRRNAIAEACADPTTPLCTAP